MRAPRARSGQQIQLVSTEGSTASASGAETIAGAYQGAALPPAGETTQTTALPLPPGMCLRARCPFQSMKGKAFVKTMRICWSFYLPKLGQGPQDTHSLSHSHV